MKTLVRRLLPPGGWIKLKRILYWPKDQLSLLFGAKDELLPPEGLNFVGGGNFRAVGESFLAHFIEQGGLKADDRVLDVGCGVGRMAIPLIDFLDENGSYEGFDIVKSGIDWCNDNLAPVFKNNRAVFKHSDIYNKEYNPKGKILAKDYEFPYESNSFDFAFATSLFTHMLPSDIENYLCEVTRVLKPGGRFFSTFYLLTEDSFRSISQGQARFKFNVDLSPAWAEYEKVPEEAIAYESDYIFNLLEKMGLTIKAVLPGSWTGEEESKSMQDLVVVEKKINSLG